MAVEFKDYYKSLGVSRSATDDEIRKAFRKLARQYHPDVAGNKPGAEDKFKEINEAYEVLSDPEKRRKYDELGANWKSGSEFRPPPGWGGFSGAGGGRGRGGQGIPDFEFSGTGFSDFFEQIFGSARGPQAGRAGGRSTRTTQSDGDFAAPGDDVEADIMVTLEEAAEGSIRTITLRRAESCPKCHGAGQINNRECPACHGRGSVDKTESHKVKIPAGILEGQSLRVPGQGEPGIGGGPRGDLYLRIKFAKHPDFRVVGSNLHYDLELAPWEAVLGANIAVPTLNGSVSMKIPAGTIAGTKMRLRERGLKTKTETGDLIVNIKVQVPKTISGSEKALWEALARESTFNARD